MHDSPPFATANGASSAPAPFTATAIANLVGGPLDGIDDYLVPIHCHQFDLDDGTSYHFSSFATAHFDTDTFIHSTLDPLLFAP